MGRKQKYTEGVVVNGALFLEEYGSKKRNGRYGMRRYGMFRCAKCSNTFHRRLETVVQGRNTCGCGVNGSSNKPDKKTAPRFYTFSIWKYKIVINKKTI